MSVEVLCKPENNVTNFKVFEYLIKPDTECDELFLSVSQRLQKLLEEFCSGTISYDELIQRIKRQKLLVEPIGFLRTTIGPIISVLPTITTITRFKDLKFSCYKDPTYSRLSPEFLIKITTLIFQGATTGEVPVDQLRKVIQEDIKREEKALEREGNFIARIADREEKSVCVASSNAEYLASRLREEGYRTKLIFIGLSLSRPPTPHELLRRAIKNGNDSDETIKELALEEIIYLKECGLLLEDPKEAEKRLDELQKFLSS